WDAQDTLLPTLHSRELPCDAALVPASLGEAYPVHFTIGTPGRLLRASYDPYRGQLEFSDGRPALVVDRAGSALEALRRAFPGCGVWAARGRPPPPASGRGAAT